MILVIDNYDSFVHNLARHIRQLGLPTQVFRNDRINCRKVHELEPEAIVISPGPCTPRESGCSLAVVEEFSDKIPILGVCLGHQAIVQQMGGAIVRSDEPIHGSCSPIFHADSPLFSDIPSPFMAGRYHSLIADPARLPDCLTVTAWTDDDKIMAVSHKARPLVGVQFHPESILTEQGYQLLYNFLDLSGLRPTMPSSDKILSIKT